MLLLSDAGIIFGSLSFTYWARFYSGLLPVSLGIPPMGEYIKAFLMATIVFIFIFRYLGLYSNENLPVSIINEFSLILKGVSGGIFSLMAITFLYRDISYSRSMVFIAWPFTIITITAGRYIVREFELFLTRKYDAYRRVAIIGTGKTCQKLIDNIRINIRWKYKLAGIIKSDPQQTDLPNVHDLGMIDTLPAIIQSYALNEVILTVSSLPHKTIEHIIIECEKQLVNFKLVPDMFELLTSQVNVVNFGGISLLGLREPPLHHAYCRILKKIMDISGAIAGISILSPLLLFLAILIKTTSKGPIIYRQQRCGEDGKIFTVYKFRTMEQNAEQETGPVWAQVNDPRRTKLGSFLRRYNLDELPQLFNVLKGEMSLVGPRPERPHFVEKFKTNIPRYMSRHLIKSGMTGWAQVNGLRGNTSIAERIKYDLYYMENWSFFLDIKILIMTFFTRKNAY